MPTLTADEWADIVEVYGAHCFRGLNHCPACLELKPCPCDASADAPEPAKPVAPPEERPVDPELSEPVEAAEQPELWEGRKDLS